MSKKKKVKTVIHRKARPKCPVQRKAKYDTYNEASYAMRRAWSHDPSMDMKDIHVYECDRCGKWHFGHISYYKQYLQRVADGEQFAKGQG